MHSTAKGLTNVTYVSVVSTTVQHWSITSDVTLVNVRSLVTCVASRSNRWERCQPIEWCTAISTRLFAANAACSSSRLLNSVVMSCRNIVTTYVMPARNAGSCSNWFTIWSIISAVSIQMTAVTCVRNALSGSSRHLSWKDTCEQYIEVKSRGNATSVTKHSLSWTIYALTCVLIPVKSRFLAWFVIWGLLTVEQSSLTWLPTTRRLMSVDNHSSQCIRWRQNYFSLLAVGSWNCKNVVFCWICCESFNGMLELMQSGFTQCNKCCSGFYQRAAYDWHTSVARRRCALTKIHKYIYSMW